LSQTGIHISGHNDKLDTDEYVAIIKTTAADILSQKLNLYRRLINMKWGNLQMLSGKTPQTQHSLWSFSPPTLMHWKNDQINNYVAKAAEVNLTQES